jgi:hypothetical protein
MSRLALFGRALVPVVPLALLTACLIGPDSKRSSPSASDPDFSFMASRGLQVGFIPEADDSEVPPAMREAYRNDAARLVMRRMEEEGSGRSQRVSLPDRLVQSVYNALIHVYNAEHLAARDSVVQYRVHALERVFLDEVVVYVDSSTPWLEPWLAGEQWTGEPHVDRLLRQYDLRVEDVTPLGGGTQALILVPEPVNPYALARKFETVEGMIEAYPNGGAFDGDDITWTVTEKIWEFVYTNGASDCILGCLHHHHWAFEIDRTGEVRFTGSWGDPMPPPPFAAEHTPHGDGMGDPDQSPTGS